MYQRIQAQSDFLVENAKNLLKEINEEYNVRAVSYGLCLVLRGDYSLEVRSFPIDSFVSSRLVLKKESVKGGSVHK
jgi:hypothetical protein